MEINDIKQKLVSNRYPGRGIIIGRSEDNESAYIIYFIMGRSENSRNRIFTATEDGIKTEAYDPSKMTDPSLIIYHPVRKANGITIVTNGDQTDTIVNALKEGHCFRDALLTREFEPDAPNYTPRISGAVLADGSYKLSILKSLYGNPACCCRYFFEYDAPFAGLGHFIHTYKEDGSPIPSFEGEPVPVKITGSLREYADLIWASLNEDNKVSLFARSICLADGKEETIIFNKHGQEKK